MDPEWLRDAVREWDVELVMVMLADGVRVLVWDLLGVRDDVVEVDGVADGVGGIGNEHGSSWSHSFGSGSTAKHAATKSLNVGVTALMSPDSSPSSIQSS